jgi:hypothetical protein
MRLCCSLSCTFLDCIRYRQLPLRVSNSVVEGSVKPWVDCKLALDGGHDKAGRLINARVGFG